MNSEKRFLAIMLFVCSMNKIQPYIGSTISYNIFFHEANTTSIKLLFPKMSAKLLNFGTLLTIRLGSSNRATEQNHSTYSQELKSKSRGPSTHQKFPTQRHYNHQIFNLWFKIVRCRSWYVFYEEQNVSEKID
jgi:hypothetical protein